MTYRRPMNEEFPGLSSRSQSVIVAYRSAMSSRAMARAWAELCREWLAEVPDKERAEVEDILRKEKAKRADHNDQDQRD